MPLQNILQGNYNTGNSPYQIKLPIELGIKIADNDPVRLLDSLVDAMDLTELNNSYGRHVKKTADPVKLFKIVVFGMMKKIYSARGLEAYIERTKKYIMQKYICGDRNSYSKTDYDATFMRLKEDAMHNGQLKPAYNVQHGVDSEYIVWADVSAHPTDTLTLIPFLRKAEEMLGYKYKNIVADAGYESEEKLCFH